MKKKLTVLTGAGMSAESGLSTFRDSGGLWEEYDVMKVASIRGWQEDPAMVLRFYNERRKQLATVKPNAGHNGLASLEEFYDVALITQNVDDLHERAGSSHVLHLHGKLTSACSATDKTLIYDIGYKEINTGDVAEDGGQLRPDIVWFGEQVPAMDMAILLISKADIVVVIGTSLNVYPAAGLVHYVSPGTPLYIIDPANVTIPLPKAHHIKEPASRGVVLLTKILLKL
ncbi:MAG: NAD-dependent deacylase [Spirochaetes bacterium]|jgi:NAD-dependent deacetylase|nr:NAD-dependent deacylase [Spirochaetota bacterium]